MTDIENADCQRCGKSTHLAHDAPQPCGEIRCDTCPGCECPICLTIWNEVCS